MPLLRRRGVHALSVGVNGVSAPPGVPKNTPFWWRDEPSGEQLLAFWHPGRAGGDADMGTNVCVCAYLVRVG